MRILHLLSQLGLTGAEVYAQQLIEQQINDGHEVFIISDKIHVPVKALYKSMAISNNHFLKKHFVSRQLKKFLIETKIDVIHCHSRAAVRHAHRARKSLKSIAMVTTLHGRQHFSWSKRWFHIYGEYQIAICENVKKSQSIDFKFTGHEIKKISNPFDINLYQSNQPAKDFSLNTKLEFNIAEEKEPFKFKNRIAWIGRSTGPKGEIFKFFFQDMISELLTQYPKLNFDIICHDPQNFGSEFLEQIEKWNQKFNHRIKILSTIQDLKNNFKDYDLVLGSGRVAIESILCKTLCFAMGEATYHGIVQLQNVSDCMDSNFGDIDFLPKPKTPLGYWNFSQLKNDFIKSCQKLYAGIKSSESDSLELLKIIQNSYSLTVVHQQIMETYRAALFKRHIPNWIPILMYHKIPDVPINSKHKIFVTKADFEKHCLFFQKQNFSTLWFSELYQFWMGLKPYSEFPKKPLILTFDDGYRDNLTNADPILKQYGHRANIFVLANHQITQNTWDRNEDPKDNQLMTFAEKNQLSPEVFEIGSHGFNHKHLTQVPTAEAELELKESKIKLEQDFGSKIYAFAYPFGSTNERITLGAEKNGYDFAVNTDQGGLLFSDNRWSLFRVNIFPNENRFSLWKKTRPWYRIRFYKKHQH